VVVVGDDVWPPAGCVWLPDADPVPLTVVEPVTVPELVTVPVPLVEAL